MHVFAKKTKMYTAVMDLNKMYARIGKEVMLVVLQMYEVGGNLLGGVEESYSGNYIRV